jgi:deoxyribodipyrimidine photo-lyase
MIIVLRFNEALVLVDDNRALSQASKHAIAEDVPLITLFVISPDDYRAHDRSARRIDFTLRNLRIIKEKLAQLYIPLHVMMQRPRGKLPDAVVSLLASWNVTHLFANIEHEVDELRRDIRVSDLASGKGIRCTWVHDKLIIEPGALATKGGKPYTVRTGTQVDIVPFLTSIYPGLFSISEIMGLVTQFRPFPYSKSTLPGRQLSRCPPTPGLLKAIQWNNPGCGRGI